MKNLKLAYILLFCAFGICLITGLMYFPKKEAPIPDTELVKCLEKKILSGEISQEKFYHLKNYFNNSWSDDSTVIIRITKDDFDFDIESKEYEYLTYATLEINGKDVELSKHESNRLVEITDKQIEKFEKIEKVKEKKEQKSLRAKFLKNCK